MGTACQQSFLAMMVGLSATGTTLAASEAQLDEVLISARRTVQNPQDVPVSVSVLSAERLADHGINTLEKLPATLPDLILTRGNSGSGLDISHRGIGPNFSSIALFAGTEYSIVPPADRYVSLRKVSGTDGETLAAYGQLLWTFLPGWQFTAGAPYTPETKNSYLIQPYVNPFLVAWYAANAAILGSAGSRNLTFEPETAQGVELNVEYLPAPTRGLTLRGTLDSTEARYQRFVGPCNAGQTQAQGCNPVSPPPDRTALQDLKGKPTADLPRWTGTIGAERAWAGRNDLAVTCSHEVRFSVNGARPARSQINMRCSLRHAPSCCN